ncbi:MAG: WD40 repeat domain-containing protein [Acidobacteria bacterium]|nr:WD40 repeat domain-containing protein [Acidobacteriota bacterium]
MNLKPGKTRTHSEPPLVRSPQRPTRPQARIVFTILVMAGLLGIVLPRSGRTQPRVFPGIRPNVAVVVNGGAERSISLIDAAADIPSGPFLGGQLGAAGTELVDVAVAHDGSSAIVSNSLDRSLSFIDLGRSLPSLRGTLSLPISLMDVALSPDGRIALVTGGAADADVITVDVEEQRIISPFALIGGAQASAVEVAPDSQTVLVCAYLTSQLHVLQLHPEGTLTHRKVIPLSGRPMNVAISPLGKSVIVPLYLTPDGSAFSDSVEFLVIESPMDVFYEETLTGLPGGQQSAQFTPNGERVLVLSTVPRPDQIVGLYDLESKALLDRGERIDLFSNAPRFSGVDVIAISPDSNQAYVGNPGHGVVASRVALISVSTTAPVLAGSIPMEIPYAIAFPSPTR